MTAQTVTDHLLHVLRSQFYPGDAKRYFQQRWQLLRAITELARRMKPLRVVISADRYLEIHMSIIQEIKRHGDTSNIRYFGGYFEHVIQEHMRRHWDVYYSEGKGQRNVVELTMEDIIAGRKQAAPASQDDTCHRLADAARLIKPPKRKRKLVAPTGQGELFAL